MSSGPGSAWQPSPVGAASNLDQPDTRSAQAIIQHLQMPRQGPFLQPGSSVTPSTQGTAQSFQMYPQAPFLPLQPGSSITPVNQPYLERIPRMDSCNFHSPTPSARSATTSTQGFPEPTCHIAQRLLCSYGSGKLRCPGFTLVMSCEEYDLNPPRKYFGQEMPGTKTLADNYDHLLGGVAVFELDFSGPRFSMEGKKCLFKVAFSQVIQSSNIISENRKGPEDVQTSLAITMRVCNKVCEGDQSPDLVRGGIEYREIEDYLRRTAKDRSETAVLKHRNAIYLHAMAAMYMFGEITTHGRLTEQIIWHTYRMMTCTGGASPEYRQTPAPCLFHSYMDVNEIPGAMYSWVAHLDQDIAEARDREAIDPIALAAKCSNLFDYIHSFNTHNGRMARLILNALLLRYAGVLLPFGQEQEQHEAYRQIAALCAMSQACVYNQDLFPEPAPSKVMPYSTLANWTLRNAADCLQNNFAVMCVSEPKQPGVTPYKPLLPGAVPCETNDKNNKGED